MNNNSVKEITSQAQATEDKLMARFSDTITNKQKHEEITIPMESIHIRKKDDRIAPALMILLPGFGQTIDEFIENGLVETVRESDIAADLALVNAHFGYYKNRCVEDRLYEDIILEAKKVGYRKIWLIGISMGAVGSLAYLTKHADSIEGVLLMSPFLAQPTLINEIMESGGLKKWQSQEAINIRKDAMRAILHWLKNYYGDRKGLPKLFLGYGKEDIFYESYQILSDLVDKDKLLIIEGGHDWVTWREVFKCFIYCTVPLQSDPKENERKSSMEERLKNLIAVGASVAANCQTCLEQAVANALKLGITKDEIAQAVEVAKGVRKGAANSMDKFAFNHVNKGLSTAAPGAQPCDCCS